MFSKNNSISKYNEKIDNKANARKSIPSIFGLDLVVSGDVYSDGELHIDGKFEGNIKCRNLNLGKGSEVKGTITADSVSISGNFDGKVIAGKVFLSSTSYVVGEITHESLEIELGAYLEGVCHRTTDAMPAEKAADDFMLSDMRETDFVMEIQPDTGK